MNIDDLLAALDEQFEIEENIDAAELSGELTHDEAAEVRAALEVV